MEVVPGIYSMMQPQGAFVHSYLIETSEGLTLIDTLFSADAHIVLNLIQQIGRKVTDLRRIILTHAHKSHLGGLARLKQLSGAPIYAHEWETGIISGGRRSERVSWVPSAPWVTWPLQVGLNLGLDRHTPCPVDHALSDGESLGPLQVVFSPGHTPGHVAFYWPERKALFAGDAVVTWPKVTAGWPGFMLDWEKQRVSVKRLASLDVEVLATGHGEPIRERGGEMVKGLVVS